MTYVVNLASDPLVNRHPCNSSETSKNHSAKAVSDFAVVFVSIRPLLPMPLHRRKSLIISRSGAETPWPRYFSFALASSGTGSPFCTASSFS